MKFEGAKFKTLKQIMMWDPAYYAYYLIFLKIKFWNLEVPNWNKIFYLKILNLIIPLFEQSLYFSFEMGIAESWENI